MKTVPRLPVLTGALSAAALVIHLIPAGAGALSCSAPDLALGQVWRLWTCHLVHWSTDHLLWDVFAFALLGTCCEFVDRRSYAVTLGVSATLIPLCVAILQPHLVYGGLSGIDVACFVLAVATVTGSAIERNDKWMAAIGAALLVGLFAKIGFEVVSGSTLFVQSVPAGFVAVPLAHAVGALLAAAITLRSAHQLQG